MSDIMKEITAIRSLSKDVTRNLSNDTIHAIQNIKKAIVDNNHHFKKVTWRTEHYTSRTNPKNQHSSNHSQKHIFGNRPNSYHKESYNKEPYHKESYQNNRFQHISIPLTRDTSENKDDNDNFITVSYHKNNSIKSNNTNRNEQYINKNENLNRNENVNRYKYNNDNHTSTQKYVSKFKKASNNIDDDILNKKILSKLNKFSENNYDDIKEFITHIVGSGENDMVKRFMKLVFEKAVSEEIYCPLYAKLISELSKDYPILLDEMSTLYSEYMKIFEEVADGTNENYNELCQRNTQKKYRRGYSQFLTQLIMYNVIDVDTFTTTISKIINQIENSYTNKDSIKLNEELADCLFKIIKDLNTFYNKNDSNKETIYKSLKQYSKEYINLHIKPLTMRNETYVGISNKARFTFLDIYEHIQKL